MTVVLRDENLRSFLRKLINEQARAGSSDFIFDGETFKISAFEKPSPIDLLNRNNNPLVIDLTLDEHQNHELAYRLSEIINRSGTEANTIVAEKVLEDNFDFFNTNDLVKNFPGFDLLVKKNNLTEVKKIFESTQIGSVENKNQYICLSVKSSFRMVYAKPRLKTGDFIYYDNINRKIQNAFNVGDKVKTFGEKLINGANQLKNSTDFQDFNIDNEYFGLIFCHATRSTNPDSVNKIKEIRWHRSKISPFSYLDKEITYRPKEGIDSKTIKINDIKLSDMKYNSQAPERHAAFGPFESEEGIFLEIKLPLDINYDSDPRSDTATARKINTRLEEFEKIERIEEFDQFYSAQGFDTNSFVIEKIVPIIKKTKGISDESLRKEYKERYKNTFRNFIELAKEFLDEWAETSEEREELTKLINAISNYAEIEINFIDTDLSSQSQNDQGYIGELISIGNYNNEVLLKKYIVNTNTIELITSWNNLIKIKEEIKNSPEDVERMCGILQRINGLIQGISNNQERINKNIVQKVKDNLLLIKNVLLDLNNSLDCSSTKESEPESIQTQTSYNLSFISPKDFWEGNFKGVNYEFKRKNGYPKIRIKNITTSGKDRYSRFFDLHSFVNEKFKSDEEKDEFYNFVESSFKNKYSNWELIGKGFADRPGFGNPKKTLEEIIRRTLLIRS